MMNTSRSQTVHRWYTRPVFFVADVNRAARFYVEMLGFEQGWHEGNGAGTVCQVNHGECEIILCVRSPIQATYPSGRINTAVGAVTAPIAGSSHAPSYSALIT